MATGTRLVCLKCPSCGAELNIEEGRDICFCTYCGAKILVEQSDEAIKARSRERMVNDISDKAMQYVNERRAYKDRKQKESLKTTFMYLGLLLVIAMFCFLYSKFLK